MDVVGVVDSEGRLNDRQLHDELDARRTAQAKICSRRNAKLPAKIGVWKAGRRVGQILEAGRIEAQGTLADNAVGAAIKKQHGLKGVADDGNAVLGISPALRIAARKSDGI